MEKSALGKKGEMFVLKTLLGLGYTLSDEGSFEHLDMAIKNKIGKHIRIQIKTTEKGYRKGSFRLTDGRDQNNYIQNNFDFVLVTDLKEILVLPYEFIKRKHLVQEIGPEHIKFKNHFELLDFDDYSLFEFMIDEGIERN